MWPTWQSLEQGRPVAGNTTRTKHNLIKVLVISYVYVSYISYYSTPNLNSTYPTCGCRAVSGRSQATSNEASLSQSSPSPECVRAISRSRNLQSWPSSSKWEICSASWGRGGGCSSCGYIGGQGRSGWTSWGCPILGDTGSPPSAASPPCSSRQHPRIPWWWGFFRIPSPSAHDMLHYTCHGKITINSNVWIQFIPHYIDMIAAGQNIDLKM